MNQFQVFRLVLLASLRLFFVSVRPLAKYTLERARNTTISHNNNRHEKRVTRTLLCPFKQRSHMGFFSSHWYPQTILTKQNAPKRKKEGKNIPTLTFLTRHVKQPVLLRVYLGRFLWETSESDWATAT
jgi:hypothetical protein